MAGDSNKLVGLGIVGGLGYLLYKYVLSPAAAPGVVPAVSSGPAAASSVAPAAGPAPASPTPAPGFDSLDLVYQRLQAFLQASNVRRAQGQFVCTPWEFSSFLVRVSNLDVGPAIGGPDLWPGIDTANPPHITLPQFWGVVAPWLAKNKGLSGFGGLGFYASVFRRARPIQA